MSKYHRHEYMHVDNSACNLGIDKRKVRLEEGPRVEVPAIRKKIIKFKVGLLAHEI